MDEVIRPEDFFGDRLCTLDEYATWMSSENRAWLVRHLGITEVAESRDLNEVSRPSERMDKEKEKAMNSIFGTEIVGAWEAEHKGDINITKSIGIGTQVRDAVTKEYLGKVVKVETVVYATIETRDGDQARVNVARIEVAPKLTPEQAWSQLPLDIVKFLVEIKRSPVRAWGGDAVGWYGNPVFLTPTKYSELRHQAYVLLGGAGVKVTEDVKERVRSIIETLAGHLGIRIA